MNYAFFDMNDKDSHIVFFLSYRYNSYTKVKKGKRFHENCNLR